MRRHGTRRRAAMALVCLAQLMGGGPVLAASAEHGAARRAAPEPPARPATPSSPPATPAPPPESQPYDAQLIRLSEILGALSYLGTLCKETNADEWRTRMQALLEAEGTPQVRKDRFAGAYNRGVQGYGLSYRTCTPNARLVIQRFRAEGARIARDVENRYRAS